MITIQGDFSDNLQSSRKAPDLRLSSHCTPEQPLDDPSLGFGESSGWSYITVEASHLFIESHLGLLKTTEGCQGLWNAVEVY